MINTGEDGWRDWLSWRGVMLLGFVLALIAGLGAAWIWSSAATPADLVLQESRNAGAQAQVDRGGTVRTIEIFVSGAVAVPGMYRLQVGLRVADAIAAAGGLLPDADPDHLPDLAARLTDGKQVKVPRRSSRGSAKLDLNAASAAQLAAVPGLDPATAQAIVDFRDRYGGFASVGDLHSLLGLDTTFVSALRRYLTVSP
jgi:competence protein ComEA